MKKRLGLTLLTGLLLLFVLSSIVSAGNEEILIKGIQTYYQQNYENTIQVMDKIISNDGVNEELEVQALYYQALSHIKLYNVIKAKDIIEELENYGYEYGTLYWKLGEVYLNKEGQFDSPYYNEAKKQLVNAQNLGINTPKLHKDLAIAYVGLGLIDQATRQYELVLNSREEGGADDFISLASLHKKKGNINEAIENYQRALKLETENISLHLNLGSLYLEKEEYRQAINILNKGVEISPDFAALRFKLAKAYYLNNDFETAIKEFEGVIENNKNTYKAYFYLGKIYEKSAEYKKAVTNYEQAINYNPDYVQAYIALGDIYLEQGYKYKAISRYTTAIEKNETYPEGHYHLALAYNKLEMKESAIAELRKTLHLSSEHKEAAELLEKLQEE